MIKTLTIALIIAILIIFFLILGLIGQLDDLCEYEKKVKKAIKWAKENSIEYNGEYGFIHVGTSVKGLLEILGSDKE